MANVRTSAIGGGTSGTGNRTVAITAAVGDLIVVFGAVSGVAGAATCSDGGTGGTYTSVAQKLFRTSADSCQVFVRDNLITTAGSITVTYATGSNVSAEVCAVAVSGMSKAGASAIFQSNGQANQAASSTPAPVVTNAIKTYNLTLTAVGSNNTSAGPTKPATFGLLQSAGQISNNIWLAVASQDKGFTSATVTWASTCATTYGSLAVELDASPFSHIQGAKNTAGSVSTVNCVLGAAPTAGNVVCSGIAFDGNITSVTCKDSNNNSYTVVGPATNGTTAQCYAAYLLSAPANATATLTWSWTTNVTSAVQTWADEFDPCGNTVAFDNTQTGTGASGTTINTPSITPSSASSILWAVAGTAGTISAPVGGAVGTATKLGSWWGSGGAITNGDMAEYALGLSGANAVQFTQSTAAWACVAMSIVVATSVTVSPTGSSITGSITAPTATGGASVSPTGSAVSGTAGTITGTGGASVSPTGTSLTGTSGSPTLTGTANVSPTGVALTASAGSVTVFVSVNVNVSVTGSALTLSIGSPVITGGATVSASGNSMTASAGDVSVIGNAIVSVSGSGLSAASGDAAIAADAIVQAVGSALESFVGTTVVSADAVVAAIGSAIMSAVGDVTVHISGGGITVTVTGGQMGASVGTVTIETTNVEPHEFPEPEGTSSFDSITINNPADVVLTAAGTARFIWPGYPTPLGQPSPVSATANGWGLVGGWAMPYQLLTIPGTGRLSQSIYTIEASGYITLPSSALTTDLSLLLEQNYFIVPSSGNYDDVIIRRDNLASVDISVIPASVVLWRLIARLRGGGPKEGYMRSDYTFFIDDVQHSGTTFSNSGLRQQPLVQLSIAAECSTGPKTSAPLEVKMTQFTLRRGI